MSSGPRNRYVTLALFLAAVIFAGLAVQRWMESRLNSTLEEGAFPRGGDAAAEFRRLFDEAAGETRIVLLLSAGSLSSEQDIDALRRLLREQRRAPARVIAVWRGREPLRADTTRFGDGRVRHVWDRERRLFAELLEGTVMVYRAGTSWGTPPPAADEQAEPARAAMPLLRRVLSAPAPPAAPAPAAPASPRPR